MPKSKVLNSSKSKKSSTAASDQQSTRSGSAASVISRKASTLAKKGPKATKAAIVPFKKAKRSRTQSSVTDNNEDMSVAYDNPLIDFDDDSAPIDISLSASDSEVDPQKELGML